MKNEILLLTILFTEGAGLVTLLTTASVLGESIGVFIVILATLIGLFSLTSANVSYVAWFIFAIFLFVACFAFGYLAYALRFPFGNALNPDALGISVLLTELAIVSSTLYFTHKKFEADFKKAGYLKEEYERELDGFTRIALYLSLGAGALALGAYYFLQLLPELQIDSISVLVIATVVYFAIARYVLRSGKKASALDEKNRASPLSREPSPSDGEGTAELNLESNVE
jgi:hypothetical protein